MNSHETSDSAGGYNAQQFQFQNNLSNHAAMHGHLMNAGGGGYGRSNGGGQGVISFPMVKNSQGVGSLQSVAQATDNIHSQANNNNNLRS